jgi:hypothetical protein
LSSQTIEFTLDGQSCSAATDGTGTASCTVTPTTAGVATLSAAFAGGTPYVAAQATRRVDLLVAATLPAPTVTIGVNPSSIAVGGSATLTWSSANATSCTASGAWSGTQATSGSQTVSPGVAGTDTYTLTCTGSGGASGAPRAVLLLLLVAGGSTGAARAASPGLFDRLYLGVRVGAMPLSMDTGRLDAQLAASGYGSVTAQKDTNGTGETVYLGIQLSRHNAFEIAYTNRESRVASLSGTIGSVTDLPALLSATAGPLRGYGNIFSASYRARIRLLNRLYLDPRIGGFYWSTRERVDGLGTSFTTHHRGGGLTTGLGLSYRLWRSLYAGVGADYFRGSPRNDATLYGGSLEWRFGGNR